MCLGISVFKIEELNSHSSDVITFEKIQITQLKLETCALMQQKLLEKYSLVACMDEEI